MIGIWCFPWTDEKERKGEGKKRAGGYVAYVVVGGFKISCGEWARLGLMSHTQRRPSKEKKKKKSPQVILLENLLRIVPLLPP